MDLQFHMAGEASGNLQSRQKGKQTCLSSQGSRKEKNECSVKGEAPYKTIRSHETYSLSQEQHEGNHPMIQLPPTRSLPWRVAIMGTTIQDEIWVGTEPNHIILSLALPTSHILLYQLSY